MSASESPLARKLGSFMPLMPDELRCVAELESTRRSVAPRTEIVYEGQKDHAAWLLLDGWANSYKLVPDGGRQIIGFPIPGDFMGLRSILLRTSDHSFESLTDAVISEVSQQRITQIFEDLPRLATAIMWGTSRDEAMVVEHLVSIGRRSAIERTAHFFLELGQRLALIGRVTSNGFACPLNQYVLADALGLSAIHVNRILRQLRERGLITLKAQQVIILDLAGLEDLAGFDSGYLNHGHSGT
ncbi:Crp/Fnr family transcriptional regulator [Roseospirillum parvum]|uniref:cAMP-binding domain of CRP or a regulatory subunit of cAMP-dependent protein kinases n=1 Tax=Roseospirillum parvum TaxID=83401 RepID=A0A1G8F428_9PROT|nr:Crp/Fnr family transcriptional regulator [Roseospirillum parvum]SDH76900.1 cAMP-binding domain of CRP or a regulatory subunit of cAMP-dependent protein kinases [Roseospirillum parvum]